MTSFAQGILQKLHLGGWKDPKQVEWERVCGLSAQELVSKYRKEQEYLQNAIDAWDKAWEILGSDDWTLKTGTNLDSGLVYSMSYPKIGKLFKLEALVECSPQFCFEEMVIRVEDTATWNPTLLDCKILQTLNENTDICYNVAAEGAGGLVASRDFVNLRHWKSRDNIMLSAGCAVGHPDAPPGKKYVRGENGPGGWVFKPIPGRPNACNFCWILNTDLKGWIPQYAVDQALSRMLLDFLGHLRTRIANLTIDQQE